MDPLFQTGLPADLSIDASRLARKQAVMQALMARGIEPTPMPQNYGRLASPVGFAAPISQIVQTLIGAKGLEKTDAESANLANRYNQGLQGEMARYLRTRSGTPGRPATGPTDNASPMASIPADPGNPQAAAVEAILSRYPQVASLGKMDYEAQLKNMIGPKDYLTVPNATLGSRAAAAGGGGLEALQPEQKTTTVDGKIVDVTSSQPKVLGYFGPKYETNADGTTKMTMVPDASNPTIKEPYMREVDSGKLVKMDNANKVTVSQHMSPTDKGNTAYREKRGQTAAVRADDLDKAAESAWKSMKSMDSFISASKQGLQGGAAPVLAGLQNFLTTFGFSASGLKDVRQMDQAIGEILSTKMGELGARGLTDKDMEVLRAALPRMETDRASREAVAGIVQKANHATLMEWESQRQQEAINYPDLKLNMPSWVKDWKARKPPSFEGEVKGVTPSPMDNPQSLAAPKTPKEEVDALTSRFSTGKIDQKTYLKMLSDFYFKHPELAPQ